MKALTVRLPDEVWKGCLHRLVDDMCTWQDFLLPILTAYSEGAEIRIQPPPVKNTDSK